MDATDLARAAVGRDRQRQKVLANILRILDHADASTGRTQVAIELAMVQIRALITGLPDGLLRERAWRALKPQVLPVLERMALSIGRDLVLEAALMTPEQARWAVGYLETGMAGDAPGAAALRRATTGENNPFAPRTVEAFPGQAFTAADLGRVGSSPELLGALQARVPPEVLQQVQGMRVMGGTLQQWFGDSVVLQDESTGRFVRRQGLGGQARDATGAPRFAQFGFKSIDRHVRAGFLAGNTSEEIAQNLIADEIRGQMRLGQSAVSLKSNARAIARTGLSHLSEQVHQAQWKAMAAATDDYTFIADDGTVRGPYKVIQGWQWDASNDSRTCPSCSVLDQKIVEEREELPAIPYHVQCRCQCLPKTRTSLELDRRYANNPRTGVVLTNEKPPAQGPKESRDAYLNRMNREGWAQSKRRGPSGERYHWRRIEWQGDRGSTADFLGRVATGNGLKVKPDAITRALTLQEYFGTGRAGARRAAVFTRLVSSGRDPHQALQDLVRGSGNQRRFVPAADLAKRWPEWAEAIEGVGPIRSVRQQKQIARGKPMGKPRRGY